MAIHQLREGELSAEAWRRARDGARRRATSTLGPVDRAPSRLKDEAPVDNRGLAYNLLDFLPSPNFLGGRGD